MEGWKEGRKEKGTRCRELSTWMMEEMRNQPRLCESLTGREPPSSRDGGKGVLGRSRCQLGEADTTEKPLADRDASQSGEEGGSSVFLLSVSSRQPGGAQARARASRPGKQHVCSGPPLSWGTVEGLQGTAGGPPPAREPFTEGRNVIPLGSSWSPSTRLSFYLGARNTYEFPK